MTIKKVFIFLCAISSFAQHYDRPPNFGRQINHFQVSAYKLYASDLIFGAPHENGLSKPIYRIENFDNYFYKLFDIESGSMLSSYVADEKVMYSKYGTFWAINPKNNSGYNIIYGIEDNDPVEFCSSEIFHEGELIQISELNNQYLTLYRHQSINNYSLDGELSWSYRYHHGELNRDELFLSSDETLLIINKPDVRVSAIDMATGEESWKFEGKYQAKPIPFDLNSNIILFDHYYDKAGIINKSGKKLHELEKPGDLRAITFINGKRLVSGTIVIPDLKDEERRVRLPSALGSRGGGALTPITWSTEGKYFAIVYGFQEKRDPPDSTVQRYRVDVVSASGREMGFFFPRFREKLDHKNILVQISNDGSDMLFIGRQSEGPQFICREYSISL